MRDRAEWRCVRLGDIASKIGSGATPRGGKESYHENGISLIRSLNVYDFVFDRDGLAHIDKEQANELSNVIVEHDDILLNITGASVARCCMVPQEILPARVNQHVAIIRIIRDLAEPAFVFYSINSPQNKSRLLALAQGGATREALTKATLENFEIRVPPISVQRAVASVLIAYDKLIGNNFQRIDILEEVTRRLYREWFANFRFPGHGKTRSVGSSLGAIPNKWQIRSLDQLMDFQGGAQPPKSEWAGDSREGYVRMIQIRDYQSDSYLCYVKDSKNLRKCTKDDIMIARYGASVARICEGLEGAYNVALVRVVPKKNEYREFLRSYLKSETFQKLLISMSGRTAQAGFNKSILKSIQVAVPEDLALMSLFQEMSDSIRKLILSLRDANKTLVQTRDFVLPKLISGGVSIEKCETEVGKIA